MPMRRLASNTVLCLQSVRGRAACMSRLSPACSRLLQQMQQMCRHIQVGCRKHAAEVDALNSTPPLRPAPQLPTAHCCNTTLPNCAAGSVSCSRVCAACCAEPPTPPNCHAGGSSSSRVLHRLVARRLSHQPLLVREGHLRMRTNKRARPPTRCGARHVRPYGAFDAVDIFASHRRVK